MSWFNVWDGLKNKTCRYLLQRYLGQFLEEQLNLEQLKVELYNGKATVKDVSLKVQALNELFEAQGWAFEVIGGHIGLLTVTVPWNALMTNDSSVEVSDLFISLRPTKRQSDGIPMLESMWSSVSSSMQLAEECMKQKDDGSNNSLEMHTTAIIGLEKFAETIDNVLNRIRAKFVNTVLKLDYPSSDSSKGISVIISIQNFCYKNETGSEKCVGKSDAFDVNSSNPDSNHTSNVELPSVGNINPLHTFAKHYITLNGLLLYTEEYSQNESIIQQTSCFDSNSDVVNEEYKLYSPEKRNPKMIPIIEIKGQQLIQIKMKQSEETSGPKIHLNVELGSIYTFISPRQIHLLLKLWDAFYEDKCADDSHIRGRRDNSQTNFINDGNAYSMESHKPHMTGIIGNHGIWGDDFEKCFAPPVVSQGAYSNNSAAKSNKYCDSLSSSMSSSNTVISHSKLQRKVTDMESSCEILNFNISIISLVAIILHEDILFENDVDKSKGILNDKSQFDMICVATQFFESLQKPCKGKLKPLEWICEKNHLFLQIAPVFAEGSQQRKKNIILFKMSASATKLDFSEVLDKNEVPLIVFDRNQNLSDGYHKRPEIHIVLNSTFSCNSKEHVAITFDVTLENCILELDISIYDRLSCLFGLSPFGKHFRNYVTNKGVNINPNQQLSTKSVTRINLISKMLDIKLRFPIVEGRSARFPWQKQNIRNDFLLFTFHQLCIKKDLSTVEIVAKEIDIFYCEESIERKIHFLKTGCGEFSSTALEVQYPKITVLIPSHQCFKSSNNQLESYDGSKTNIFENKSEPQLPFSSKRVCRHSDTMHSQRDMTDESETVLLPGDTEEINRFCELTMKASELKIKINFPNANITFESKQLYEIIYNRLNSDILMWEPSSPILKQSCHENYIKESKNCFNTDFVNSVYGPPTSLEYPYSEEHKKSKQILVKNNSQTTTHRGVKQNEHNDISANIFCDANLAESVYFSVHQNNKFKMKKTPKQMKLSNCSIEIAVGKGSLVLFVPVRNAENHVMPGQSGKFEVKIENLCIFSVSGYNSNDNLGYVCLQIGDVEVYHCGLLPEISPVFMPDVNSGYMKSTFYKVPNGLTKGTREGNEKREMISLVLEMKKLPEKKIKRLRVTAGIQGTALRHNFGLSRHTWFNQLIDFLDVADYPIEGYLPFGIITEIQLHMWDCAVDYRPKNLPYRAVVEVSSFTISSNIISSVQGCSLRFVLEDCNISIAPYDNVSDEYPDFKVTFIPSTTLVPVLDIGLFDISMRISDNLSKKRPKFDLRCSIHDVHLRICSDSGSALAQFVAYIANDGDIINRKDDEEKTSSSQSSFNSKAEILFDKEINSYPETSKNQQERINVMVAEAVQEAVTCKVSTKTPTQLLSSERGIEVFFFPDENKKVCNNVNADFREYESKKEFSDILNFESNVMSTSYYFIKGIEDALPQVKTDLGDIENKGSYKNNKEAHLKQDDDYCIIPDDENSFMYRCGIKNVELSDDPLRIVDNHFCLPTDKPDLLRAPENFPMAEMRYTLCEMTLTWHLYGGRDFPVSERTVIEHKTRTKSSRMSDVYRDGVSYTTGTQSVLFVKKPKEKLTWKTMGGPERNHEVLVEMQLSKVRFSHEVYPSHTSEASRQVLLVNEIEIRDRLQTSDINKFLYHPNPKNISNKSLQHMVLIKALHVRPNPEYSTAEECSLRISLLPMRLHIDQNTLIFLTEYFTNIGDNCSAEHCYVEKNNSNQGNQRLQIPVMAVSEIPEAVPDLAARKLVTTNLDILMEDKGQRESETTNSSVHEPPLENSSPIFFREVIFSPDVLIRFDYHGRHVELSRGPVAGLLMGLGQLQCSEIRLQKLVYRRGLLGLERLFTYLCKEWLKDIKRNQLPKILSGVGPTYAVLQLFQGIYDLFWLPIEQYQKGGRIMKGLQLGAKSFTARTALAALEITSRIIQLLQLTAETAFDMVSPGPSVGISRKIQKGRKKRPTRPKDIREGVANAYLIVKEGINDSATTLMKRAAAEHDQKGYTGAVGAVMRQIPQLVVCPAVLATQATTNILGGVKSSLVPDANTEAREKWKNDSD